MDHQLLIESAKNFLKNYGYLSKETGVINALLFSRPTGMGVSDELLIYFHNRSGSENFSDAIVELYNGPGFLDQKFA